jgi:formylmethanofuran dehydrogenase subunit B
MDGIALSLSKIVEPPEGVYSDEHILDMILKGLKEAAQ